MRSEDDAAGYAGSHLDQAGQGPLRLGAPPRGAGNCATSHKGAADDRRSVAALTAERFRIRRRAMAQLRQEVDPDEAGLDAKALDRLDQHFAHYVDEGRLPGYLVAVARGG